VPDLCPNPSAPPHILAGTGIIGLTRHAVHDRSVAFGPEPMNRVRRLKRGKRQFNGRRSRLSVSCLGLWRGGESHAERPGSRMALGRTICQRSGEAKQMMTGAANG
jgi:hypothetical protein